MFCDKINKYSGSSEVLIFGGKGINSFCLEALNKKAIEILDGNYHRIEIITTEGDLRRKLFWERNSHAGLLVPGGHEPKIALGDADGPGLLSKLNVDEIKRAIKNGTPYFGTCAGGILGAESISQRLSSMILDREGKLIGEKAAFGKASPGLGIVPVDAYAPILGNKCSIPNNDFVKIVDVNVKSHSLKVMHLLGPAFKPLDEKVEVVARYSITPNIYLGSTLPQNEGKYLTLRYHENTMIERNQLAETVFWKENETGGKAILTGCHYEIDSSSVRNESFLKQLHNPTQDEVESFALRLEPFDKIRDEVLKGMWSSLGLHVKPEEKKYF
jgi:glutamine amidotransferase-like uncharacterized protein